MPRIAPSDVAALTEQDTIARPPERSSRRVTAIEDLTFYFRQAAGELGLKSSFGALVDRAMSGGGGSPSADRTTARRLAAAHRARRVHATLKRLSSADVDVLTARYAARLWPSEVRSTFGELAAVALLTPDADSAYAAAHADAETPPPPAEWLRRIAGGGTAQSLLRAGEALLAGAHERYLEARRALRDVDQEERARRLAKAGGGERRVAAPPTDAAVLDALKAAKEALAR